MLVPTRNLNEHIGFILNATRKWVGLIGKYYTTTPGPGQDSVYHIPTFSKLLNHFNEISVK